MQRHATVVGLSRLAGCMVYLTAVVGTSSAQGVRPGTSVSLTSSAPTRFTAGPPVSLGQRAFGSAARRDAMLSVADSILRVWGWKAASVDAERASLRTEWLYFTGRDFTPDAGRQCEDEQAVVGLRFEIAPRQLAKDSAVFMLRGEARIADGVRRADAERFARGGFATIGSALQAGARDAGRWPDTLAVELQRLSGEVGMGLGQRVHVCATLRP